MIALLYLEIENIRQLTRFSLRDTEQRYTYLAKGWPDGILPFKDQQQSLASLLGKHVC